MGAISNTRGLINLYFTRSYRVWKVPPFGKLVGGMISISRNLDRYPLSGWGWISSETPLERRNKKKKKKNKKKWISFVLFKEKKTSVYVNPNDSKERKREEVVDKTSSSSCENLRILPGGLKRGERVNRIVSIHPSRSSPRLRLFVELRSAHLSRSLTLCVWRVTVSFSFPLDFTVLTLIRR